jgi:hypothetical protein
MSGSYTPSGTTCGYTETTPNSPQWYATLVPPLTGPIQGSFHSTGGAAGLDEQDFLVSGALNQAANTGASSAAVAGNLNFLNPTTNLSDYPCLSLASVSGQVSGNTVNLQIIGADGSIVGQIGEPAGSNGMTGVNPVTLALAQGGYILNAAGPSYMVATSACPGNLGTITTAGDYGNICLALGSATACQLPITLTPSALTFGEQVLGTPSTTQTITLANASGAALGGLTLMLANNSGATNFTETDACGVNGVPSLGEPFDLESAQSCVVTVTFAPQKASHLSATLTVASPNNDMIFTAPITGTGVSADAVSTRGIDSGSEGVSESSLSRLLSFANRSGHPAQSLPSSNSRTFLDVEHHAEIY